MRNSNINSQKKAFLEYEANQWFTRNKAILDAYNTEDDVVVNVINKYNLQPENVLEIGSSAGYRLQGLKNLFPAAEVYGIDPSIDAAKYGREHYPSVNLETGTADQMHMFKDHQFDLVIVGFVFYVIDRPLLLKVIAEIDRILSDKGVLIMVDFFSEKTIRNHYEHITQFEAFSFKQNYEKIFTATEMYHLVSKESFHHSSKKNDSSDDYYNKCSVILLKKDIYACYK